MRISRRGLLVGGIAGVGVFTYSVGELETRAESDLPEPKISARGMKTREEYLGLSQSTVERVAHKKINAHRNAPDLEWSPHLAKIARFHSWQMSDRGFYAHEDPDGNDHTDRYERFGMDCQISAENILYTYAFIEMELEDGGVMELNDSRELGNAIGQLWLDSPPHRQNIMNEKLSRHGIGVWFMDHEEGVKVYATQNFC